MLGGQRCEIYSNIHTNLSSASEGFYLSNSDLSIGSKVYIDNTGVMKLGSGATYTHIATTYPNPQDGWTENVKDTDYTYRYNGTSWVAISANAIPDATTSVKGLMTTTQVTKLNSIAAGAEVNVQSD